MIDITQELFSGKVYEGDTPPSFTRVKSLERGDGYSLTDVTLCAHNGTHLDAPAHFIRGGKTIEQISLFRLCGKCSVARIGSLDFSRLPARLLVKGVFSLSAEQAEKIAAQCLLFGCEAQSVGDAAVHRILLSAEIAVLEGLDLSQAAEGEYGLFALPAKLGGADGAPVRAVLTEEQDGIAFTAAEFENRRQK